MTTADAPVIDRTVYVVVNITENMGAMEWREQQDDLPTFGPEDQQYRVNLPSTLTDAEVTDAFDAFLGEYDLPEGWEVGPI